jgi:phage tail sheath protein FI
MMEQSIKIAMGAFVFEPNNQNTWLDVKGSITNFLTDQWTNGVLVGASPAEAFSVEVGLGTTMTPVNVLDGFMIVEIKLAVVRPAEFIILRFEQKMQTS